MATKLGELRAKFEKLTPGTKEYNDTLALIQAEQTKQKSVTDKATAEKTKKDAQRASKEEKYDLDTIKTLETYIKKRNDLGETVPETIQTQYDNLKKKYPKKVFQEDTSKDSGSYLGSTFVPGKQTAPTPAATPIPEKPKVPSDPKEPKVPLPTAAEKEAEALGVAAGSDFTLPETIFNNVDSLKILLEKYVKTPGMTANAFRKELRNDVWYKKNSAEIKARYVQFYNYRDLKASGQADGSTDYEKQIATLTRKLSDKARLLGSAAASDPEALARAAENMYITNQGIDDPMTTDFLAASIRPITSTLGGVATQTYSGQALKDYQAIQSIARSNGFRVKDIVPGGFNERQVLEGIATGRLDANRIAQDARILAQQGQPQYVRDLLSQGYNLDQVFAPYRQTMANLLEINPDEIDLNDSTLRSAISDKGDMNIYDFKKTLKKDNRWQYTENAKQEVADATLKILRDFGLQG